MVFTIKKKLWLGIGILIGLFILVGLISLYQKRVVDEKLREIVERDEPISASAYEMEINLYETGLSLFSYLFQRGSRYQRDSDHLQRFEKDKEHFRHYLKKYSQLAETKKGKELGLKVDQGYKKFIAVADELIRMEYEQEKKIEDLLKKFHEIDDILDVKIQASIKPDDPHAYRKLQAALEMEINTNGIAKGLGNFLRTHHPQYEARVTKDEQDFKEYFEIYKSLPLSPQEREWAKKVGLLFNESVKLTREIIDLDKGKLKGLDKFIEIRVDLDNILDDEIQAQTQRDLEKSKEDVLGAAKRASLITIITVSFAIVIGILLGSQTVRSIIKPVNQLLLSTKTIAKGDLSKRVDIQSRDEIGLLGESFNLMIEGLQKTTTSINTLNKEITERKQAQEELQRSEARFRTLAEFSPVGIFLDDGQGNAIYVNNRCAELVGLSPKECLGLSWVPSIHPDDRERVTSEWAKAVEQGTTFHQEYRWVHGDGSVVSTIGLVVPVRGEDGEVISFAGTLIDITEHKQVVKTIKESEEKYRSIFENAVEGIYRSTLEGRFLNVNPAMARIFGYESPHQMVASITDIAQQFYVEPTTRQAFIHALERGGEMLRLEYEAYRKDGSTIWIVDRARAVRGTDGTLLFLEGFIEDITERKQAEEELQKSEERARGLAEENLVVAGIGRIISSTLDIEKIYELFAVEVRKVIPFDRIAINIIYPEKDSYVTAYIEGKDIAGFRPGNILPLAGSLTKEVALTRSSMLIDRDEVTSRFPHLLPFFHVGFRSFIAVPLISKDQVIGVLHIFSVNSKAYMEADNNLAERIGNQIAGAIANAQLFLEHERLEKEKSILEEQYRQSQKMEAIGKLAGGIAHDFNNILTVIKGYTQLSLYDLKEGDPIRENITVIQKAADRAADLTRQLLAFSRRQVMETKVLDLNVVLKDVDKMLHRVIGEDIELVTILAEDLGRVKADPGQIEQVIMNLAVNARDAMPSGGKLTIETANVELDETYARNHVVVTPGRYVMLSLSDTGGGMSPEIRERIFEPFFTTKEIGKGTGLGLSTVYGIVKQSGGYIWVYSEPGQGTTFKIYLPRVDEALTETKEIREEEILHGSETILVAEDDEEVRKLAAQILEGLGYRVLKASEGSEAIRICKEHEGQIHLLLTDVVMPGMSGRELATRLLSLHTEIKVLYMSGYPDNAIVHHGVLEKGMNYIQKPFPTVEGLARKVREVLDG